MKESDDKQCDAKYFDYISQLKIGEIGRAGKDPSGKIYDSLPFMMGETPTKPRSLRWSHLEEYPLRDSNKIPKVADLVRHYHPDVAMARYI